MPGIVDLNAALGGGADNAIANLGPLRRCAEEDAEVGVLGREGHGSERAQGAAEE